MKPSKIAGIALIVFFIAFAVMLTLEAQRPEGDNPVLNMAFIQEHHNIFTFTGQAFMVMAVALAVGLVGLWDGVYAGEKSLMVKVGFLFGLFAVAFLLLNGVLRMTGGTLMFMAEMDPDFAISGYLALQIVGTQGLVAGSGLSLDIFVFMLSLHNWQAGKFPRLLSVLGVAGLVSSALGFVGQLLPPELEFLFVVYMLSLLLVNVWLLALGIWAVGK
jgi:hypothetical protein